MIRQGKQAHYALARIRGLTVLAGAWLIASETRDQHQRTNGKDEISGVRVSQERTLNHFMLISMELTFDVLSFCCYCECTFELSGESK